MKKWIAAVAVVFGLTVITACGNGTVVDTKAGKITENEFVKELKDKYGKQVLQDMVYKKLLSKKYKVTDKEVNDKIHELMQENNITSQDQLQSVLASQGVTMKDFRDDVKTQVLLFKATTDGVKVSDKEMRDYFNKNKNSLIEVKASHILVKDKKKADEILQKLKNGEDFAKLAKTYSTDDATKNKGGDLGWIKKGQMVAAFEKAAFSMKKGELSGPVKTEYGYHIIKVTDRKDSYEDFKSEIKNKILEQKAKPTQEVLDKLVKENDVKVKDKQFKDLFNTSVTTSSGSDSNAKK
ncbi:peptidylprolyl isomerase [Caenibacillus caldisaponilyticus]|jgi:foldase protein PrsA|uniref:peptidylprolyl isomerase n=1 Tax=Caenibacillus caldisaponilyticus TaxID=1674942 RepID=UPI000988923E|nr:peptidylprolyl isomerase [Caenibacillus caldisaponilyticus]